MANNDGTLLIEDARIIFRNFAGNEGKYNRAGDRNFCVVLEDPKLVEDMLADGWNVKYLRPREDGDQPQPYLQVSVGFKVRPPRMVLISSKGRVDLGEQECEIIDWVDINKVDLIIRPYHWNVNGDTGIKAYLKSIFITINEDYLELKYSDVPMAELESATTVRPLELEDPNIIDAELVEEG